MKTSYPVHEEDRGLEEVSTSLDIQTNQPQGFHVSKKLTISMVSMFIPFGIPW